jgi:tRNA U34 5-methylaminomethyl-2-thiouridine-forming methyltransferase MnmC
MLPTIIENEAGLKTLFRADFEETYHSIHGAIAESKHVFIESGLNAFIRENSKKQISILEIGFGSGLNAILSYQEILGTDKQILYSSLETVPLPYSLVEQLGYQNHWSEKMVGIYQKMHNSNWNTWVEIDAQFALVKLEERCEDYVAKDTFDVIYFDAFAPDKQASLWTLEVFEKIYHAMNAGGILVTYSAKGDVRRAMIEAGFEVNKIAGLPPKRHMLRAYKR